MNQLTFGVLIGHIDNAYYESATWSGLESYAKDKGINLITYPGWHLDAGISDEKQFNIIYDLINESVLDGVICFSTVLCHFVGQKALVKFLKKRLPSLPILSIGDQLTGYPSIVVDNQEGIRKIVTHLIEKHHLKKIAFVTGSEHNMESMERLQGYREALLGHGIEFRPELVIPGEFWYQSGKTAVKILLDERKIKCDAIVFANDEMAMGGLEELNARGIKVPEEIAITGFDDIDAASYTDPPLTTIIQPLFWLGYKSAEILHSIVEKKKKVRRMVKVPAYSVIRQSCGCAGRIGFTENTSSTPEIEREFSFEDIELFVIDQLLTDFRISVKKIALTKSIIREIVDIYESVGSRFLNDGDIIIRFNNIIRVLDSHHENILLFQNMLTLVHHYLIHTTQNRKQNLLIENLFFKMIYLLTRLNKERDKESMNRRFWQNKILSTAIFSNIDFETGMKNAVPVMRDYGCQTYYIYLYASEPKLDQNYEWVIPEKSKLLIAVKNGEITDDIPKDSFKTKAGLWNYFLEEGQKHSLLVYPLCYAGKQYGIIVIESMTTGNYYQFYSYIREQISIALYSSSQFKEKTKAELKLLRANDRLMILNREFHNLSLTDELTALYNRRGFNYLCEQHHKVSQREKKNYLLFYMDLDGLKQINDRYGHEEGDAVIMETAKILVKTFREPDIVARIGGDEFTVLAVNAGLQDKDTLVKRLTDNIDRRNQKLSKPYKISISVGSSEFNPDKPNAFKDLLAKADEMLYRQKALKKKKI